MAHHQQHHKSNTAACQSPYQLVCQRLAGRGSKGRQKGLHKSNWCCPVCKDRGFHLGVEEVAGGKVLLNCFHGCSADAIVAALDLTLADLFAEKLKGSWQDEPLTLRADLQARKARSRYCRCGWPGGRLRRVRTTLPTYPLPR